MSMILEKIGFPYMFRHTGYSGSQQEFATFSYIVNCRVSSFFSYFCSILQYYFTCEYHFEIIQFVFSVLNFSHILAKYFLLGLFLRLMSCRLFIKSDLIILQELNSFFSVCDLIHITCITKNQHLWHYYELCILFSVILSVCDLVPITKKPTPLALQMITSPSSLNHLSV